MKPQQQTLTPIPPTLASPDIARQLPALVPQLAALLKNYFVSSSTLTPPHAQGSTGNRSIALKNNQPETQTVTLVPNGTTSQAIVTFANTYTEPPNVQLTIINGPGGTNMNTVHVTANPGTRGCIIESTGAMDKRQVMVYVYGNIVP